MSSQNNTNNNNTAPGRGRGGTRRGAGNTRIVSSRGDIKAGGITIKEWQRTPVQLLHEYAQHEKRPKPRFDPLRAEEKGKKKFRVVLQDPKKPGSDKDLLFTPQECFDDTNEAKHSVALLALSYVRKNMPLEKKLPEPYKSMWLDLINEKPLTTTTTTATGEKNSSAAASSSGAAEPKGKANSSDTAVRPPPPVEGTSVPAPATSSTDTLSSAKPSNAPSAPMMTTVKKKGGAGKNKKQKVSSQHKHASKADAAQAAQQKQQHRKEIEKRKRNKEAFLYANEDPALTMSDEVRNLAENALQKLQNDTHMDFGLIDSTASKKSEALPTALNKFKQPLVQAGFSEEDSLKALTSLNQREGFSKYAHDDVIKEALNWLCLNLPAHRLPSDLQPAGNQLTISRPSATGDEQQVDSNVHLLNSMGFSGTDSRHALNLCSGNFWSSVALLFAHMRSISGAESDLTADNQTEVHTEESGLDHEIEAMYSIFGEDAFHYEEYKVDLDKIAEDALPVKGDFGPIATAHPVEVNLRHIKVTVTTSRLFPGFPAILNIVYVDDTKGSFTEKVPSKIWQSLLPLNYPASVPWIWIQSPETSQQDRMSIASSLIKAAESSKGRPMIFLLVTLLQDAESVQALAEENDVPDKLIRGTLLPDPATEKLLKESTVSLPATATSSNGESGKQRRHRDDDKHLPSSDWTRSRSEELYAKRHATASAKKQQTMKAIRRNLPISQYQEAIAEVIRKNPIVLLSGETGSGKTTQVPQYLLEDAIERGNGGETRILCTQPRRIAAVSVAARVADERCEPLGPGTTDTESLSNVVGYHIRGEKRCNSQTHLVFCTTGILLRQLQSGLPAGVTHILVDEVHERNVDTDFLLAVLRQIVKKHPALRVVLMSATMNARTFAEYFAAKGLKDKPHIKYSSSCQELIAKRVLVPSDVPQIFIPGFIHPVREVYVDELLETFEMENSAPKEVFEKRGGEHTKKISPYAWLKQGICYDVVVQTLDLLLSGKGFPPPKSQSSNFGAILVFLPGIAEINKVERLLRSKPHASSGFIVPLHGSLPSNAQNLAFKSPPKGKRKVVLATNIAETSVTIDDITVVLDCGREKVVHFDHHSRLHQLVESWISQAGANQRRGRAGRAQPGVCYRLWPSSAHDKLPAYSTPEIKRISLENLVLQVKALKLGDAYKVLDNVLDAPTTSRVTTALRQLEEVGAVEFHTGSSANTGTDHQFDNSKLTSLGRYLANLPLDARLGKILVYGYMLGCADSACCIVSSLSTRNPLKPIRSQGEGGAADPAVASRKPFTWNTSDHLTAISMYKHWMNLKDRRQKQQYCREMNLSEETLEAMKTLDKEFATSMRDLGFTRTLYSEDEPNVVSSVIAAGLYPNVARVIRPKRQYEKGAHGAFQKAYDPKDIKFYVLDRSLEEASSGDADAPKRNNWCGWPVRRVFVHPSSVLFDCGEFKYPWLVYHAQVETTKSYIRDATMVSPYALALFGGHLDIDYSQGIIAVGSDLQVNGPTSTQKSALSWIEFKATGRIAVIVQALRKALDALLSVKLDDPDFDISNHLIQKTIVRLIKGEGW